MLTTKELIAKIDAAMKAITTSDLGSSILRPEKADRFIRTVSEATPVLQAARRLTMNAPTRDIDRVAFTSRILGPATEDSELTNETKPTFATNQLVAIEVGGVVGLTDNTLEDNIERQNFENTLLDMIAERAGVDLEELFFKGDKSSSDSYLRLTDGWLKLAGNQLSSSDFDTANVESMFDAMLEAVPKKYFRDPGQWRFYVPWNIADDYRDKLRARNTSLGDEAQTSARPLAYKGVPIEVVPNVPAGNALLVAPMNLVYGIYREIRIEPDRMPKARKTDFVVTLRADCHYEDENAAVRAQGYTGAVGGGDE